MTIYLFLIVKGSQNLEYFINFTDFISCLGYFMSTDIDYIVYDYVSIRLTLCNGQGTTGLVTLYNFVLV